MITHIRVPLLTKEIGVMGHRIIGEMVLNPTTVEINMAEDINPTIHQIGGVHNIVKIVPMDHNIIEIKVTNKGHR